MIAKFEPSGTHFHKGKMKVRIDLYPEPTDKTYAQQYVDKPIIPSKGYRGIIDREGMPANLADYTQWIDSLPKAKVLNPCLCHFITIDEDTSLIALTDYVKGIFDKATLAKLDNLLSAEITDRTRLAQIMKPRCGMGKLLSARADVARIKNTLNSRFLDLEVRV